MKKDISKRVLCMVCCLSLTLGIFAYRPPEAKAVFASPAMALGVSLVASVMVATTAELVVSTGLADTIGYAINDLVNEYVSSWGAAAVDTAEAFFGEIAGGASLLEDGAIQLSATAGNLMAGFINWLQSEKVQEAGGAISVYSEEGILLSDGSVLPIVYYSGVTKGASFSNGGSPILQKGVVYTTNSGFSFYVEDATWYYKAASNPDYDSLQYDYLDGAFYTIFGRTNKETSYGVGSIENGIITVASAGVGTWLQMGGKMASSVSAQPKTKFQAIPNAVPDYSSLVVNPALEGLDLADQQAAANSIMDAIYAGTFSPTVSIEAQATDVPGTDTDEDDVFAVPGTDADILDWTKYIGQKVAAVPQAIAQAVAGVFAPDPVLVNDITGAFSQKFGFVEDLKQIGDDFFGMTPSSEPPVVWIHLENAEGKYNYGGTVKALDMSWFQRYKADVDRITGGFLWVAYLWLLFRRAPDILGGAGMVVAEGQYISEGTYVDGDTGEVTGHFTYRRSKRH